MSLKSQYKAVCTGCDRLVRRCLCAYRPKQKGKLEFNLKLLIIQSQHEQHHHKNSAAFLYFGLEPCEKLIICLPSHHLEHSRTHLEWEQINQDLSKHLKQEFKPHLLYPSETLEALQAQTQIQDQVSQSLSRSEFISGLVIVLDMTWGHSKRLLSHCPQLSHLPKLSLNPIQISTIRSQLNQQLNQHQTNSSVFYQDLRSGQRRKNEINSFEATLFALMLNNAVATENIKELWASYQKWLKCTLYACSHTKKQLTRL